MGRGGGRSGGGQCDAVHRSAGRAPVGSWEDVDCSRTGNFEGYPCPFSSRVLSALHDLTAPPGPPGPPQLGRLSG